jgi:hypothetical protein
MRELFLHVGMHKTGTSSIQQTLFDHRPLLQEAGLSYWGAEPNHSVSIVAAFHEEPHLYHMNRRAGRHTPEAATAWGRECRARLEAFLAEAPGPRLILSGEDIAMLSPAATDELLALVGRHVGRTTVLGFVRPPRSFMVSVFQQRVRGGSTLEDFGNGIATGYRRRFRKYIGHPGVAGLKFQLYERAALKGGCSIATFLELCGAPPELYPKLELRQLNVTASRLGVVLNLAANEAVPVFLADGAANPDRSPLLARFLEDVAGRRLELPPAMLAAWLRQAQPDIAWMEERLGQRFALRERAAAAIRGGPEEDFRSLSWQEIQTLVGAVNLLLLGRWKGEGAQAAAAGGEAMDDLASRFLSRPGEASSATDGPAEAATPARRARPATEGEDAAEPERGAAVRRGGRRLTRRRLGGRLRH